MAKEETIAEVTKTYEEKIIELEKQHQKEIETIKMEKDKEKETALNELKEEHRKELADVILGRKEIKVLEEDEEPQEKSFFEKGVESTKKYLGIN